MLLLVYNFQVAAVSVRSLK